MLFFNNFSKKTILNTLNDKDNITIVTYSTEANILFTDCNGIVQNKQNIETELDNIIPTGTTNMWDGIKTEIDILKIISQVNKLKVIKLFTDDKYQVLNQMEKWSRN